MSSADADISIAMESLEDAEDEEEVGERVEAPLAVAVDASNKIWVTSFSNCVKKGSISRLPVSISTTTAAHCSAAGVPGFFVLNTLTDHRLYR